MMMGGEIVRQYVLGLWYRWGQTGKGLRNVVYSI